MKRKSHAHLAAYIRASLLSAAVAFAPLAASAQVAIPGPADVNRIPVLNKPVMPRTLQGYEAMVPDMITPSQPPKGAKDVMLVLKQVTVHGTTKYTKDDLEDIYRDDIGKKVSLEKVWKIAAAITSRYRNDGYFLSRAFVPAQEVSDGRIIIKVVEGYISEVEFDDAELAKKPLIQAISSAITAQRPTKVEVLERQHLLLSDLPGLSNYQGTLIPNPRARDGQVKLVFAARKDKETNAFVSFDNYGSRFLGPHEVSGGWKGVLLPLQETSINGVVSIPTDELAAISASHRVPLTQALSLEVSGGYTKAEPGYTLTVQDVESRAINTSIGLNYQLIRQRRENLKLGVSMDARNSESTILNTTLSKDKIRALRLKGIYDKTDDWQGYNYVSATLSRGIDGLGASNAGDINISRAGAKPDFTKLELDYKRLQVINEDWSGLIALSAQKASGSLYSSEEMGFGGQEFGRAYDQSELTGDEGVAASVELRYQSLPQWNNIAFMPYGFYDIGRVWNDNSSQQGRIDASSAGAGVKLNHSSGLNGGLQVAVPLTKPAATPLYGSDNDSPRIGVQMGYEF